MLPTTRIPTTFLTSLQLFTTTLIACLTLWNTRQVWANSPPQLADGNRTYLVYNSDGMVCLYASFQMKFHLYYYLVNNTEGEDHSLSTVELPEHNSNLTVSGDCGGSGYQLSIEWISDNNQLNTTLKFVKYTDVNWSLRQISFTFDDNVLESSNQFKYSQYRTFSTNDTTNLFNRTFQTDQYFYCKGSKTYYFTNQDGGCNSTDTCSYVTLDKAVIYIGNFDENSPIKQECLEDRIAFLEFIIPIGVGSGLAVLLLFVLALYIIAFTIRKVSQARQTKTRRRYKRLKD